MIQETYIKITEKIRSTHYGERIIVFINRLLTDIVYISFLVLLVYLALHRDKVMVKIVMVTGISFVLVSVIRHFINAERPRCRLWKIRSRSLVLPSESRPDSP